MARRSSKRRRRRVGLDRAVYARDYDKLAEHLRLAREAAGLTQEELAVRLGVSQSFVSKCEHGLRRIDLIELRYLCHVLGVRWLRFLEGLSEDLPRLTNRRAR